jgi:hypothetical protein
MMYYAHETKTKNRNEKVWKTGRKAVGYDRGGGPEIGNRFFDGLYGS